MATKKVPTKALNKEAKADPKKVAKKANPFAKKAAPKAK